MAALAPTSVALPRRALAVAIAALLVIAGAAAVARRRSPAPKEDVEDVVRYLQGFVERTRGLRYRAAVPVTLLDDAAFRARLRSMERERGDEAEIEATEGVLQAIGLLGHDVDLRAAVRELLGGAVGGLYDPKTKELLVRGGRLTPHVRQVLAHELTHALDDQWFGLDRPQLKDDSEAAAGFSGLAEGDAVRVENAYLHSLAADLRAAARAEEEKQSEGVGRGIPPVLLTSLVFPYQAGPRFVDALLRAGGQARLDAAFRDPPASTEHLLHPDRYLAGDRPQAVARPVADRPVIDDDVVGELFLLLMLQSQLPADEARAAATGWGGDHYVAWRAGAQTCLRATFVMDTPRDTAEFVVALRHWAARRTTARVDGTGPVTLTTCG